MLLGILKAMAASLIPQSQLGIAAAAPPTSIPSGIPQYALDYGE